MTADLVVDRLRAAGCVFAEQEASALRRAITGRVELEERVRRRVAGEPLERVLGEVALGPLRLSVGPGVFVPRQRTWRLARLAVARARRRPVVVETCAGVAPVAAAVCAAAPGVEVHAVDVDPRALGHVRRNLPRRAAVHQGGLLGPLPPRLRGRVGVLAAVPPYCPTEELALLAREAREHEPEAALHGGRDGLDVVRAVVAEAAGWLAPDGRVLVELAARQVPAAVSHAARGGLRPPCPRGGPVDQRAGALGGTRPKQRPLQHAVSTRRVIALCPQPPGLCQSAVRHSRRVSTDSASGRGRPVYGTVIETGRGRGVGGVAVAVSTSSAGALCVPVGATA